MVDMFTLFTNMFLSEPDMRKKGFLTTFFKVVMDSFTDADTIEIDVVRSGDEIAPVVRDLNTGSVTIVQDVFTNKQVPFPVYSLDAPVSIHQLMQRMPGQSAYITEKVNWMGALSKALSNDFAKMARMLRNSIELQAAQVLQTGTVNLTDINGIPTYVLDFKPKATHFPTVTTSWGTTGETPLEDIDALVNVIRQDGYVDVTTLIFGVNAWKNLYKNAEFREMVKRDNLGMGMLDPALKDKGAQYMGYIFNGAYQLDLYAYNASYQEFSGTVRHPFIDPNKVIFLPAQTSLEFRRYFGGIPNVQVDPVFDPIFGNKINIDNEYDIKARVYADVKKNTFVGEVKTRPLMFPVGIDQFGCLTTQTA